MITIKEMKDKQSVETELLVAQVKEGVTNSGAPYLSITFQDKSGTMEGKLWDVKPVQKQIVQAGHILHVRAEVLNYRGALQMRVVDVRQTEDASLAPEDFVAGGSIDKPTLMHEVEAAIASVHNPTLHTLLEALFADCSQRFYEYPAAMRNHHEFASGLATHVVGMLRVGNALCDLYPILNRDLLISGILVHDMGKLVELTGTIVPDYTTEGRLLGHISIMQAQVAQKAQELHLEGEEIMLLRHMILSHHGEYEFGSPVLPMIPEAEALHLIDNLDARMEMMRKALDPIAPGEFTTRIFALENRLLYRKKMDDKR